MTVEEVKNIIRIHVGDDRSCTNDHKISLEQVIVLPQRISVIERTVRRGRAKDQVEDVWLVGQENADDGYRIVMRDGGLQFGLAVKGFSTDKHLFLTGWYGGLKSAFLAM